MRDSSPSEFSRTTGQTAGPKVSLGVPVYNGAQFLAASLESLIAQTFEDLEIFISDNGSTDGTEEICRTFAERDARIRYARSAENRGASWNYKNVVRETSGPYFKWATHDDLLEPTYIERCVAVLDSAPETVALVYPKTVIIDEDGNTVTDYEDNLDIRDATPHARLRHVTRNIVMANASFGLIRRSALAQSRLLDAFSSADYIMMAEFALAGEFWEIPEPLFLRRQHPGMSRGAAKTASEVANWFKPGHGPEKRDRECLRLFYEHFVSIEKAPLSRVEKLRCAALFAPTFLRRHGRRMFLFELLGRTWHQEPPIWRKRGARPTASPRDHGRAAS